ncbi:MAG: Peptide-methionine (S)-S-oxide reductase MsrA, partial [uncultured Gemmatimonadaceae bacterium]
ERVAGARPARGARAGGGRARVGAGRVAGAGRRRRRAAAGRVGGRDVRVGVLLVHRGGLREGAGRGRRGVRLHRRPRRQPHVRAGVVRRDGAPRGGAGVLRPEARELRAAPGRLLEERRPGGRARPVLRQGRAVHVGDLRGDSRGAAARRGVEAGGRALRAPQGAGRDGDRRRRAVLQGRGVPPGVLQEEPDPVQVLPDELRPRRAPARDRRGRQV